MPDDRTPGVYIEEQPPTGPIVGVGTNNAAFLGAAKDGPLNVPTKVTNPTQFRQQFGDPITVAPGHHLAYAVAGFFENGGTVAYIVRVGIASRAFLQGADDNPAAIGLAHYMAGLLALEREDDVQLVAAPGRTDSGVQAAVLAHCEKLTDRVAILDGARDPDPLSTTGALATQGLAVQSKGGYAAIYYPWLQIVDPMGVTGHERIFVPPSGHIAGIYARSDNTRGVHKAPANELVAGAVSLERRLDDTEHGDLNAVGINVIRMVAGKAQPIVWGARTTAPKEETPWRYVNVRRLFIYVEESIQRGISWAVLEPNSPALWSKLHRAITEFLTRVWRSGALLGDTREEAFYVKIDEDLNAESERALGRVMIEIGIAPLRPAEFVVVRIGTWAGGSE